ncbi:hypothetical protein GOODEAATRI_029179, partial [Goodea atripinnis]
APIEVMETDPSSPPAAPAPPPTVTTTPSTTSTPRPTRSQHYNPEENTITNICTSNIILDLPHVTTRSRTGAKPPPPPPSPAPNPPTVTKIIIKQTPLPSGGVSVTSTTASSPRQPPPLQQMQSTPPPPRLQQAPPPLQAKPRGGGAAAATAPPPLQIKVVPSLRQQDSAMPIIVTSASDVPSSLTSSLGVTVEVGQTDTVVMAGEEVAEAEEGVSCSTFNVQRRYYAYMRFSCVIRRLLLHARPDGGGGQRDVWSECDQRASCKHLRACRLQQASCGERRLGQGVLQQRVCRHTLQVFGFILQAPLLLVF